MRNEVRNIDVSVKARLKNIVKEYRKTFKRRGTDILKFDQVFNKEFIEDNNRINQWKLFLKKISHQNIEFEYVMDAIKKSLLPIYNNIKKEKG